MKRGVLFLTFSGEELGLLGSSWYAEHPALKQPRKSSLKWARWIRPTVFFTLQALRRTKKEGN